ncbi:MAG: hypothetical protein RIS56_1214 [Verrucomicrobiota bacterium]|jgi:RNA polymerase sigma factor (sigma-70 family)
MQDDAELLRLYAETHSEPAFAELVRRHLKLVYSVAVRQMHGDVHLAEDVTQQVFVDCAANAAALCRHPVLGGWLYRTTRYRAIDTLRREDRRRNREQQSHIMNELTIPAITEGSYDALRPVLDEVISELDAQDRDAVTLRFFENRRFAEIGAKLRLSENSARMRVERALQKLQARLSRRGITSSAAALTAILAEQTSIAAPAGLAASVLNCALTATATSTFGSGISTVLMSTTKLKSGLIAAVVVVGTVAVIFQYHSRGPLEDKIEMLRRERQELARLNSENRRLEQVTREVAAYANDGAALAKLRNEAVELESHSVQRPPSVTGPIFDLKDLDISPTAKKQTPAAYPRELKATGVSGEAKVSLVIDAEGKVHDVEVVSSSHPLLGDAAVVAASKWEYNAGVKAGVPVNVRIEVTVNFRLAQGTASSPAPVRSWFPAL